MGSAPVCADPFRNSLEPRVERLHSPDTPFWVSATVSEGRQVFRPQLRVRHVDIGRIPGQASDRFALLERLALLEIVDSGTQLAPQVTWHSRCPGAVHHQACHLLPAAAAVDAGYFRGPLIRYFAACAGREIQVGVLETHLLSFNPRVIATRTFVKAG